MNKVPITKGFSIIELMVVIAIIGILTAVAMPAYNAFIIQSEMAQFLTHAEALKNEAIAWQQRTGTTDMSPFNAQAATYNETLTANDGSTIYTTASATGIWVDIYSFSKRDPAVKFELTGGIDSNGDWVWACGSDKPIGECNDWTTYCSKLSAAGARC